MANVQVQPYLEIKMEAEICMADLFFMGSFEAYVTDLLNQEANAMDPEILRTTQGVKTMIKTFARRLEEETREGKEFIDFKCDANNSTILFLAKMTVLDIEAAWTDIIAPGTATFRSELENKPVRDNSNGGKHLVGYIITPTENAFDYIDLRMLLEIHY